MASHSNKNIRTCKLVDGQHSWEEEVRFNFKEQSHLARTRVVLWKHSEPKVEMRAVSLFCLPCQGKCGPVDYHSGYCSSLISLQMVFNFLVSNTLFTEPLSWLSNVLSNAEVDVAQLPQVTISLDVMFGNNYG